MRRQAPASRAGPFTCYLHPASREPSLNVAIPEEPSVGRRVPVMEREAAGHAAVAEDDPSLGLVLLRAHFSAHGRTPRVEYVEEAHQGLAEMLRGQGFHDDASTPLLSCTRDSWRQVDPPAGIRVEPLVESSPWETAKRYLEVQREAYGIDMEVPEQGPKGYWPALGIGAGLLVLVGDEPAGAGGITPAYEGLADVRGLAVRPAFRGRGIGSFLLSALARVAHETGVDALLATPDSDEDLPLAARAGFVRVATLVSFSAEITRADAAAP